MLSIASGWVNPQRPTSPPDKKTLLLKYAGNSLDWSDENCWRAGKDNTPSADAGDATPRRVARLNRKTRTQSLVCDDATNEGDPNA